MLWFDCPVSIPPELSRRLVHRVKELQPRCLVNSRVGHGLGDYGSLGDNQTPAARREGAWECPGTLNDTWGFKWTDHAWKSPAEIIALLVSLAARDANYLLNVGPRPDGTFPAETTRILGVVGDWMRLHASAIQGTEGNPFPADFDWGWLTVRRGSENQPTRLHLILKPPFAAAFTLNGLGERVRRVYDLARPDDDLPFQQAPADLGGALTLHLSPDEPTTNPTPPLHAEALPRVIVAELATSGEPLIDLRLIPQNGSLRLLAARATVCPGTPAASRDARLVGVGAAGELDYGGATAKLENGLWLDGHLGGAALAWHAWLPEPGEYAVEIISVSRQHGAPWSDEQTIRLTVTPANASPADATTLETRLRGTLSPSADSKCFAEGHSPAGTITVAHGGEITVDFRVLAPGPGDQAHLGFKEVIFRRINSTR